MGKEHSLLTDYPEIASQWHPTKNNNLKPNEVKPNSSKIVWWLCDKGHEWQARIGSRSKGTGCPYCANQKVLPGYNDLASKYPVFAKEWHPNKNERLLPTQVTPGSNKKVWWICEKGHEWQATINNRISRNLGCPFCSNQRLLKGYNDLATTNPELLNEWDYDKNQPLTPESVQAGSEKKVWWVCPNGHSYLKQIDLRTKRGQKCPICNKGRHTSFPEKCIAYYFEQIDNTIIEGYKDVLNGLSELDIYLPKRKIGIEYDGKRWHSNNRINDDLKKNNICKSLGIELYRIREYGCSIIPNTTSTDIYYEANNNAEFEKIIENLIKKIYGTTITVNIEADEVCIYKKIDRCFYENSALNLPTSVLEEWNDERNGELKPESFSIKTHKKVWWKCSKCKGSYLASIANRASDRGCPYCTGHKILSGFNDLQTTNPELVKEWDFEKNKICPTEITAHSGEKVWWKCPKGHSYQAKVSNRTDLKRGCPICSNRIVIQGVNDFGTHFPELLKEWDYSKNTISPNNVPSGTSKKVWWKCSVCGFEWSATILSRTGSRKTGCPNCAIAKKGQHRIIPVLQFSKEGIFIKRFSSLSEAAIKTGVSKSSICQMLSGRSKTAGGYVWKYDK